jgi:NRPS condensation-like uncharacterized protein
MPKARPEPRRGRRSAPTWLKLDNAAKIYPATRSSRWMAVFRLSVTLGEEIDRALLQQALVSTLKRIPSFGYRLRRGLFWYYLDSHGGQPAIQEDAANPLTGFDLKQNDHFMFRVRVHHSRIALELFHALADATGAMTFLMTLAAEYLRLKEGVRIPEGPFVLDCRQTPHPGEWEDSFPTYARAAGRARREDVAYPLRGTLAEAGYIRVTTGLVDAAALSDAARRYDATVNTYLAALLLQGMLKIARADRSRLRAGRPVKLSMPVNLRRYYPSRTLRNFSSYINAPIYPSYGEYSLRDIITHVKHFVGLETTEQMMNARFSANVHAEQSRVLRAAPLFLKTAVLKLMYSLTGERYFSSVLSNLGVIRLPEALQGKVRRMDFLIGRGQRNPISVGCLTVNGLCTISFSKTIRESTLERFFFTSLVREGIHVTIESNLRQEEP